MKRARYVPTSELLAIARSAIGTTYEIPETNGGMFETVGQIAVVSVCGPLTRHEGWFWDSYDAMKGRVAAALASGCTTVVLKIDSPGGEAIGCFDVARELRAMAAAAKKPLIAFADGMAASAGYAIACAASKIYVPADGFVGSVGVKKAIVDATGLDRMMGLSITVIGSGERKLDGDPHVPTSDAARTEAQAQVDSLAMLFFELVAESRGVSVEHVRGLEAAVLHGDQAVAAKLADGVMTFNELLAMVARGEPKASAAAAEKRTMTKEEMRAWLSEKAKGEGDDADKAKAALKCLDDDEKPADDKDEKDGKDKEAKAEDAPPPPAKDDKKDDDQAKAIVSLTGELHALKAERAAEKDAAERAQLFAQRPDFSAETKATLAKAPLEMLREAVAKWPKIASNPAAALTAVGTRGEGQTEPAVSQLPPEEKRELDERMGLASTKPVIRREGTAVIFGAMTADQARAHSAAKNGGAR